MYSHSAFTTGFQYLNDYSLQFFFDGCRATDSSPLYTIHNVDKVRYDVSTVNNYTMCYAIETPCH